MTNHPTISVIVSTYNSPEWLEKVIHGFQFQTVLPDELIIADDGSTESTFAKIAQLQQQSRFPIKHVWHEDNGFQKTKILNKALLASTGEYLVFTDGDCIPRKDFIAVHQRNAQPGYFLSGGYFKLPMHTSEAISLDDIAKGNSFDVSWLIAHGLPKTYKTLKLTAKGWLQTLFNNLTPTGATWNGHNASGWRSDIFAAKGFDERMQYGGEDRELGERLFNAGIKSKQLRYSAVVVHLDHARGYVNQTMKDKNKQIRQYTKAHNITKTEHGL